MRPFRRSGLLPEGAAKFLDSALGLGGPPPEDDGLFEVSPRATDPTLTGWLNPHVVAVPRQPSATPYLWIFLGGSFGKPHRQTAIIRQIAGLGHWAINLCYPNDWTIGGLSRQSRDMHAHEDLRLQILDGQARSPGLDMAPQDSIFNRLQKLLRWLVTHNPTQGWAHFLDGEHPRWERLAVAGHSQGGGHAAIMGKQIPLARVVMLAAPADTVDGSGAPAPWLARAGDTPPRNYYGFSHQLDPGIPGILAGWRALGLSALGPLADVDRDAPPFGGSHTLLTNHRAPGGRFHGCVAVDRAVPRRADDTPVFDAVWTYLFRMS